LILEREMGLEPTTSSLGFRMAALPQQGMKTGR
jgi:hypothetical protein